MTSRDEKGDPDLSALDPARPDPESQLAGLVFALLLIDENSVIAEANHAAESLLGRSSKRLIGQSILDMIGPVDPRVEFRLAQVDSALVARDIRINANGAELRINLTVSPLGRHSGWRVVTLSEIGHEETGSEDELVSSLGAPSILAHEVKNPLAAIRGAAQLAERKLPPKDKNLARMITEEVDRIARLIDRMQQLGARSNDEPAPCNTHEAIRSAIATVRAASGVDGKNSVEISEEFDPSIPPAWVNRDSLEQVLINLVSNARDAAGTGAQGQISVRTRFVSGLAFSAIRLGRAVRLPIEITVTDNGPGIDPAMRDHVFEPFVSSKRSGQGLGLALVRKLVRDMNGSISHDRDAKKGLTHFRLHLPMARENVRDGES